MVAIERKRNKRKFYPFLSRASHLDQKQQDDEDVIGYRFANLSPRGLRSIAFPHLFSVDEVAQCLADADHKAPHESCKCGFYSINKISLLRKKMRDSLPQKSSAVLLECRYFGTMFQGPMGQRAERQQVLRCYIQSKCSVKKCTGESVALNTTKRLERHVLQQVCAAHKDENAKTISDIRDLLGTEVEWL